jgi:hypothetical protein
MISRPDFFEDEEKVILAVVAWNDMFQLQQDN